MKKLTTPTPNHITHFPEITLTYTNDTKPHHSAKGISQMKYINLAALSIFVITLASCSPKTQPVAATDHPHPVENTNTTEPFKYTITTDIDTKNENVEILVAINDVNGQYPVKYDLDCDSDGEYEYTGLTENQKCIYNKNSGTHQISVRGDIPGMFLCKR